MVVMDESDGSHILSKPNPKGGPWYILYFKRSFVNRQAGRFKGYMNYLYKNSDVFPMTYPIGEAYVKNVFNKVADRDFVSTTASMLYLFRRDVRTLTLYYFCFVGGIFKFI
jgi:hypothetical protein